MNDTINLPYLYAFYPPVYGIFQFLCDASLFTLMKERIVIHSFIHNEKRISSAAMDLSFRSMCNTSFIDKD
jgi:hypothetical protein